MERWVFEKRFDAAAARAVRFAREHVRHPLPDVVLFRVRPNQSCDDNPRVGDEVTYPSESLPYGAFHGPWAAGRVVEFLWRDGRVPEWVDIAVEAVERDLTLVDLRCCGRFTATEELLYHRRRGGVAPFSVKSPVLPPCYLDDPQPFDLPGHRPEPTGPLRRLAAWFGSARG